MARFSRNVPASLDPARESATACGTWPVSTCCAFASTTAAHISRATMQATMIRRRRQYHRTRFACRDEIKRATFSFARRADALTRPFELWPYRQTRMMSANVCQAFSCTLLNLRCRYARPAALLSKLSSYLQGVYLAGNFKKQAIHVRTKPRRLRRFTQ